MNSKLELLQKKRLKQKCCFQPSLGNNIPAGAFSQYDSVLEAEGMEKTYKFKQHEMSDAVDLQTSRKVRL